MDKTWQIKAEDAAQVKKLAAAVGISELTAKILIHRGITNAAEAEKFLNAETAQEFYNPLLMSGMEDAVDRIIIAIEGEEKICIYGDYDVDGMSGVAFLTHALRNYGANVEYYIPDRSEGYGINVKALEKIIAGGASLLISVDCGISNAKEISAVAGQIDFIITDHHLPPLEKINPDEVVAVIDPHQEICNYPDKNLCGAGVAFKIAQALAQELEGVPFSEYTNDIELVALATVADLVPLTGENRKIVKLGLKKMFDTNCIGLKELIKISGFENKKISASNVAFQIAPRLNSVGRLKSAKIGVELLTTDDEQKAAEIAAELEASNIERKEIEREIFVQAEEKLQILRDEKGGNLWTLVVADKNWNAGIIGLTASKLAEKYSLPTIIISVGEKISRGSCRSIPALHIKNTLDTMADLFENYGGHSQAAGFSIPTKKIPELKRRFDEYVRKNLTDEDFPPVVEIDALVHPAQIDLKTAEEFEKIEPCGIGNPEAVLACRNVLCDAVKIIGADKSHLSFVIRADSAENQNVKAVSFGAANLANVLEKSPVDIIFQPSIDSWNGETFVKCFVKDIAPHCGDQIILTREFLADIYKFLKADTAKIFNIPALTEKFNSSNKNFLSVQKMFTAINIFMELGILKLNDNLTFEMPASKRRNLENSRTFRLNGK
ncbi:MAG: single-stranded-DNA-specific exonuclease RecJ [Selenomonadaceae bacterium]|nr:single-stranded-DNA-specific exonuclease RecJ [Selenomonadaceae bacterium]